MNRGSAAAARTLPCSCGGDLALVIVGEGLNELDEAEAAIDDDVPLLAEHGRLGRSRGVVGSE